jgi:hypothetical protein
MRSLKGTESSLGAWRGGNSLQTAVGRGQHFADQLRLAVKVLRRILRDSGLEQEPAALPLERREVAGAAHHVELELVAAVGSAQKTRSPRRMSRARKALALPASTRSMGRPSRRSRASSSSRTSRRDSCCRKRTPTSTSDRSVSSRRPLAYLVVSHDLSLVNQLCDYIMVMSDGCIVEQGSSVEVFFQPRHEITRKLMARRRNSFIPGWYRLGDPEREP